MRCFTVNWNHNRGEAEIKYAEWFTPKSDHSGTQMVMLDAINDVIEELRGIYDEIYAHSYGEKK
jgi:hypothetical protein